MTGRVKTDTLWNVIEIYFYGFDYYVDVNKWPAIIDTPNLAKALGVYPIFVIIILLLMFYSSCFGLCRKENMRWRRSHRSLSQKLFHNSYLRLLIEAFLKLFHQTVAFVLFIGLSKKVLLENFYLHATLGTILILFPPAIACFLLSKKDALHHRDVLGRFGTLYDGIKTESVGALLYTFVFLIRRVIFVVIVCFLASKPYAKTMAFLQVQILYVIYLGWFRPHTDWVYNWIERLSETLVLLMGYGMMLNTNLMRD